MSYGCSSLDAEPEEELYGGLGGNWIRTVNSEERLYVNIRVLEDSVLFSDLVVADSTYGAWCEHYYLNEGLGGYEAESGTLHLRRLSPDGSSGFGISRRGDKAVFFFASGSEQEFERSTDFVGCDYGKQGGNPFLPGQDG